MRGSQTLFLDIFEEKPTNNQVDEKRKGRSAKLHAKRNECLVERYFYKGKFTNKRYNVIVEELSMEFFISAITVPDILNDHRELLMELKKNNPEKSYFQKKWQHLNW